MSGLFNTYQNAGATNAVTKALIEDSTAAVAGIIVTNANAAKRYFLLHNKATAPVATDVPQLWFPVPAGTAAAPGQLELNMSFFGDYERFSLGLGWSISTTTATFTDAGTAADHDVVVRWRNA